MRKYSGTRNVGTNTQGNVVMVAADPLNTLNGVPGCERTPNVTAPVEWARRRNGSRRAPDDLTNRPYFSLPPALTDPPPDTTLIVTADGYCLSWCTEFCATTPSFSS